MVLAPLQRRSEAQQYWRSETVAAPASDESASPDKRAIMSPVSVYLTSICTRINIDLVQRAVLAAFCATAPNIVSAEILEDTQRWSPGIGDPSIAGWLAVFAYLAVAVQGSVNYVMSKDSIVERRAWLFIVLFMTFLSVNKQLDLQTWVTQVGRDWFKQHGIYDIRAPFQTGFIAALALAALVAVLTIRAKLSSSWSRFRVVVIGIAGLLFFITMRATTIHHVDWMLGVRLGELKVNNLVELTSILIVSVGTYLWYRKQRRVHISAVNED
jgi:hypothetical protein